MSDNQERRIATQFSRWCLKFNVSFQEFYDHLLGISLIIAKLNTKKLYFAITQAKLKNSSSFIKFCDDFFCNDEIKKPVQYLLSYCLQEHGHFSFFNNVLISFGNLINVRKIRIQACSVDDFDEIAKSDIINLFSGQNTDIQFDVNKDLLSGYIIFVDSRKLDFSLTGRLNKLKKVIKI